jgi:hypothetical protein
MEECGLFPPLKRVGKILLTGIITVAGWLLLVIAA